MAEVVVINPRELDPFVKVRAVLEHPRLALKKIAIILEDASMEAFDEQAFGDWKWPHRYPSMKEPFVNLAGALQDFIEGAEEPKQKRYSRTPANVDTGAFAESPKARISGRRTVEVGSTHKAAALAQWGGVSHQEVTDDTRNRIAKYVGRNLNDPRAQRLRPMMQPNVTGWDTEVVQRPFLGVHATTEKDIVRTVEEMIAAEIRA